MSEVLTEVQAPSEKLAEPEYPELAEAAVLIRKRGLCQGAAYGSGGSLCAIAAIREVQRTAFPRAYSTLEHYRELLGVESIALWSDTHTAEEVAEALERAAWGL